MKIPVRTINGQKYVSLASLKKTVNSKDSHVSYRKSESIVKASLGVPSDKLEWYRGKRIKGLVSWFDETPRGGEGLVMIKEGPLTGHQVYLDGAGLPSTYSEYLNDEYNVPATFELAIFSNSFQADKLELSGVSTGKASESGHP